MMDRMVAPGQDGAWVVEMQFIFHRPKSVKRDVMTVKPDVDKLCRAILDSVSDAGFWLGDQQVIGLSARKRYAIDGEPSGVWVYIRHAD